MNHRTLLYLAFGLFAMRFVLRDARADRDPVARLRLAGAI